MAVDRIQPVEFRVRATNKIPKHSTNHLASSLRIGQDDHSVLRFSVGDRE